MKPLACKFFTSHDRRENLSSDFRNNFPELIRIGTNSVFNQIIRSTVILTFCTPHNHSHYSKTDIKNRLRTTEWENH